MRFHQELEADLSAYALLKHPFYQKWTQGTLSPETLRHYACQYSFHVDAFPRYISAAHSACSDREGRQFLLENLVEEEHGSENHPELWRRFAEATGATRKEIEATEAIPEARDLVCVFMGAAKKSYHEGLASLYAYEYQVPEIAEVKIDGLKRFYGVESPRGLAFFEVHREADRVHRTRGRHLLDRLSADEQVEARAAAIESAQALWNFLSAIENYPERLSA